MAFLKITAELLTSISRGYAVTYNKAFAGIEPSWNKIAMEVPSSTSQNVYPFMKDIPGVREWVGDRVVHGLESGDFTIKNRDWELTIGVDRNKIEDDEYGVFKPMFENMGHEAAIHPDKLIYELLASGFDNKGHDGTTFFSANHPLGKKKVANMQSGENAPWFLMDLSRPLKPLVLQMRKKPKFVSRDKEEDTNVFANKEFQYGVDARYNAGYVLWQLAYGAKVDLTQESFRNARKAMRTLKKENLIIAY